MIDTMTKVQVDDNQELFDLAVIGLLEDQGVAYSKKRGECRYLAPDGSRCAIGQLLTPRQAREADDRRSSARRLVGSWTEDGEWGSLFPERLQDAHDDAAARGNPLIPSLYRFAQRYDLDTDVIDELMEERGYEFK